jgi:hypothetical protein
MGIRERLTAWRRKGATFAVRRETMEELMKDPEYNERLKQAETFKQVQAVVVEFCRKKGYVVASLDGDST